MPKIEDRPEQRPAKSSEISVDRLSHLVTQWLPPQTPLTSVEEAEKFAGELCWTLNLAMKAAGRYAS